MKLKAKQILEANNKDGKRFSDESFIGVMNNGCFWAIDAYWELDYAIYKLHERYADEQKIPKDLTATIFRIYSFAIQHFTFHYNDGDEYKFKNISGDELYDWSARLEAVFEGFFKGQMPENKSLNIVNPLLK